MSNQLVLYLFAPGKSSEDADAGAAAASSLIGVADLKAWLLAEGCTELSANFYVRGERLFDYEVDLNVRHNGVEVEYL